MAGQDAYCCAKPIKGAVTSPKEVSPGPLKNTKIYAPKPGVKLAAIKGACTSPNRYA